MSNEIYVNGSGTLYVTQHVGPACQGDDRARWQVTVLDSDGYVTLTRDEVLVLAAALTEAGIPDRDWT